MLQYSSLAGLFRMVLVILLVYYGVKILGRIFAPFLMKYVTKKAEQRFGGTFGQFQKQQQEKPKKEGEVSIDKVPVRKSSNKDIGDYVDFEEIE